MYHFIASSRRDASARGGTPKRAAAHSSCCSSFSSRQLPKQLQLRQLLQQLQQLWLLKQLQQRRLSPGDVVPAGELEPQLALQPHIDLVLMLEDHCLG
jgi:hypothetical protein